MNKRKKHNNYANFLKEVPLKPLAPTQDQREVFEELVKDSQKPKRKKRRINKVKTCKHVWGFMYRGRYGIRSPSKDLFHCIKCLKIKVI